MRRAGSSWRRPVRPAWRQLVEALLVALVFALWARTWLVQAFQIPTPSMEPALLVGDHLLVNKFVYRAAERGPLARLLPGRGVRRGDVVVFRSPVDPRRDFVKRCVALPFDVVELRAGQLSINGRPVDERAYAVHRDPPSYRDDVEVERAHRRRDHLGPYRVPPGHLFCLGDNRDESNDSRFWGAVPEESVKGRPLVVFWSRDSTAAPNAGPLRRLVTALGATRWSRLLHPVR